MTTLRESFAQAPDNIVGKPKIIGNNTFKYQTTDGAEVIRLHHTDIIVKQNGKVTLNTDGWKTVTTKARFNEYSPYRVCSDKGSWWVYGAGKRVPFYDGITLPDAFEAPDQGLSEAANEKALKAKIKKFLTATIKPGVEIPLPSSGDCWYCAMFDQEKPVGEVGFSGWVSDRRVDRSQTRNTDHLLEHINEHYMHGTLIVNAFRAQGYKDAGIQLLVYRTNPDYARVRRVVGTYLKRRLGLTTN